MESRVVKNVSGAEYGSVDMVTGLEFTLPDGWAIEVSDEKATQMERDFPDWFEFDGDLEDSLGYHVGVPDPTEQPEPTTAPASAEPPMVDPADATVDAAEQAGETVPEPAPDPEPDPAPEPEPADERTVAQVLEDVGDDKVKAADELAREEKAAEPRKTLIDGLKKVIG
jgi:outer membrane biosynthesis protein TonB